MDYHKYQFCKSRNPTAAVTPKRIPEDGVVGDFIVH